MGNVVHFLREDKRMILLHILLLSCLCKSLAITVQDRIDESNKNIKEYKTALKDIRLVQVNQVQSRHKKPQQEKIIEIQKGNAGLTPRIKNSQTEFKSREDKQKFGAIQGNQLKRVTPTQSSFQSDAASNHNYMQKMANQLYLAQKHISLLSDYQRHILNQDPNVKNYVFGQGTQTRNPKSLSRTKQSGRGISERPLQIKLLAKPKAVGDVEPKKFVTVTSKVQTSSEKVVPVDHTAQSTGVKYVTLPPQTLTHYIQPEFSSTKNVVLQYQTPQPYTYYTVEKPKPQIVIESPVTPKAHVSPQYIYEEQKHVESPHHVSPEYEFRYKVKDHEQQNHFGHMEARTDKVTYGYYFIHLPDGRLETVKYWADKTGYHAKVEYQGEAKHPPSTEVNPHHKFSHH